MTDSKQNRADAKRARPPSDDEPWVVADNTGVRVTFRDEGTAWRYRDNYTDRLESPTVTYEPATVAAMAAASSGDAGQSDSVHSAATPAVEVPPIAGRDGASAAPSDEGEPQ